MILKRSPIPLPLPRYLLRCLLLIFVALVPVIAHAQPSDEITLEEEIAPMPERKPWIYFGAFTGVSLIAYDAFLPPTVFNAQLTTLPGSATFQTGDGSGFQFGALVELPVGNTFNIGVRAAYQGHKGKLAQTYVNTTDITGTASEANVQGTVEASFGHLVPTLYARVAPFSFPLYFYGGPSLLLPLSGDFTYVERIGGPPGTQFRTRGTSRSLGSRSFSNAATSMAVTAGVGYEHPLNEKLGLFLEAQFQPMLGDYVDNLGTGQFWQGSSLGLVLGLRFGAVSSPPPPPPPKVDTPIVARKTDTVPFNAKAVTSSGLADTITVAKKRVRATEVHALLPYIFFERDSAVIPPRYARLDPKNRRTFQIERMPRGTTVDVYYQLLNIVGQRVRDDRVSEITLTGCVSQFETDTTLARRRAEAVRDYLVSVWRVPERRIKIIARTLPANPSLSEVDTAEAARENQRVEISSENFVVERPVELPDTTFLAPLGTVRFIPPPAQPDTGGLVDGWSLDVKIGDSVIKKAVTGIGQPPKQIDFSIENRPDLDLRVPLEISSTLTIRDTLYQDLVRVSSDTVVLRSEGEYEEERTIVGGRYVDVFNLLLFSFDSAQALSFTQQASDLIKPKIDSTSRVRIVGHTDRIGLPYYNKALSQRRAEYAQQLLSLQGAEVMGLGERELLYDNQFPEGRYYSRTVTITVETPIPGEEGAQSAVEERRSRNSRRRTPAPPSDEENSNPR